LVQEISQNSHQGTEVDNPHRHCEHKTNWVDKEPLISLVQELIGDSLMEIIPLKEYNQTRELRDCGNYKTALTT